MTRTGRPGLPLAFGMPDRTSWLILLGFLVVLSLLIWRLVRAIRKQGGLRRTWRRIGWELRMTARAFTAPVRAYRRHRRCARMLAAHFADPSAHDVTRAALDRADADSGEGCFAPTVQLSAGGERVRVVVAGRDPAGSPGPVRPWADAGTEPGDWTWAAAATGVRDGMSPDASGHRRRARLPLVLGVDRAAPGVVLVDWLLGPAALCVEGETKVAREVVQALAVQLDRFVDGPPVEVTTGVHPRFPGRALDDVLTELEVASDARDSDGPAAGRVPVVVCWEPTLEQAFRLVELCARGGARTVVAGRLPGLCWLLHAERDGRLLGPGPGVDVESSGLGWAVARGVRRGTPVPRCLPPQGGGQHSGNDTAPRPTVAHNTVGTGAAPGDGPAIEATGTVPVAPAAAPSDAVVAERPPPGADFEEPPTGEDFEEPGPEADLEAGMPATAGQQPAVDRNVPASASAWDRPETDLKPAPDAQAQPDLAEPGATAPPGYAGVSASSGPAQSNPDSDPAAPGDSQERTPRNP